MFHQNDLILVAGPRGSGKSEFVRRKILPRMKRLLVLDTMHEYSFADGGFNLFLMRTPAELHRVARLIAVHKPPAYRLLYQPSIDRDESEDFDSILGMLFHMGNVHLLIEELPQYCSSGYSPFWLKKHITVGRHQDVGITATTQRPAMIPKDFVSGCRHKILARFSEANDLKYLEKSLGKPGINTLQQLQRFEFLHQDGENPLRKVRAY